MRSITLAITLTVLVGAGVSAHASRSIRAAQAPTQNLTEYQGLLQKYCITCHNERNAIPAGAPLLLDRLRLDRLDADAAVWEKVIRKLSVGAMPPQGMPRPEGAALEGFRTWLAARLDAAAVSNPSPGRVLIHRLNRVEYAYAVKDLLDIDVLAGTSLPPDSASYGFDNVADALVVTPGLLEAYLGEALRVSGLAVGDVNTASFVQDYPMKRRLIESPARPSPLGTRNGIVVDHFFPLDGEYILSAKPLYAYSTSIRGDEAQAVPQHLIITVDGKRVYEMVFGGFLGDNDAWADFTNRAFEVIANSQVRVPVKAGVHAVGFMYLMNSEARPEHLFKPRRFEPSTQDLFQAGAFPELEKVSIVGPLNPTGPGDTPSRRRIFLCRPQRGVNDEPCATKILSTLARRAYRRSLTKSEVDRLMEMYRSGRATGGFEAGVQKALSYVLASPSFLFRAEQDPPQAKPNTVVQVSDIDLASRLSFFLWSSIPDDELLNAAMSHTLRSSLEQQVRRMLADERATRFVINFTGQWLQLRNLDTVVRDLVDFPDFDDQLRQDFRRETELFFSHVMRSDRSVIDFLDADYSFLNERLARHYGVPDVHGDAFRLVHLYDPHRRGLLGQGSMLLFTAHPNGSTPTLRGKWILENILGTPPPPPPAVIPPLPGNPAGGQPRTLRDRLEQHRRNPVCASCHRILDPPGFALENFDAIGRWRATDAGQPVDASGMLADGTVVNGPVELRDALRRRSEVFVGTLTERLMVYALGRGLQPNDMPVVRSIVRQAQKNDARFTSLILGIVNSPPFQMRVTADRAETPAMSSAAR